MVSMAFLSSKNCHLVNFYGGNDIHYEDTKSNTFFSQLINLKQKGSMMEHIEDFQKLNIRVADIPEEHNIDVFIGTLKDTLVHMVKIPTL